MELNQWNNATGTNEEWNNGTIEHWNNGTMEQ